MNKFGILVIAITVLILGSGIFMATRPPKPQELPAYDLSKYLYFWGNGCPHCKNVADFENTWENKDKLEIQKYEVWYDSKNQALMTKLANEVCGINPKGMAVPLLIKPDKQCLQGDTPIIEYYKSLKF